MSYESIRRPESTVTSVNKDSDIHQWIIDDCQVEECISGNIFKLINDYITLYNCPSCHRTNVTPGKRIWRGEVTIRTIEDMERRRQERKELVFNRSERYNRAKEITNMLHDICPIEKKAEPESIPAPQ